jgi:hypothetical protein
MLRSWCELLGVNFFQLRMVVVLGVVVVAVPLIPPIEVCRLNRFRSREIRSKDGERRTGSEGGGGRAPAAALLLSYSSRVLKL